MHELHIALVGLALFWLGIAIKINTEIINNVIISAGSSLTFILITNMVTRHLPLFLLLMVTHHSPLFLLLVVVRRHIKNLK